MRKKTLTKEQINRMFREKQKKILKQELKLNAELKTELDELTEQEKPYLRVVI